jgi:hypothetical protein
VNRMHSSVRLRSSVIFCPYYLKVGQTIVREPLWGPLAMTGKAIILPEGVREQ